MIFEISPQKVYVIQEGLAAPINLVQVQEGEEPPPYREFRTIGSRFFGQGWMMFKQEETGPWKVVHFQNGAWMSFTCDEEQAAGFYCNDVINRPPYRRDSLKIVPAAAAAAA